MALFPPGDWWTCGRGLGLLLPPHLKDNLLDFPLGKLVHMKEKAKKITPTPKQLKTIKKKKKKRITLFPFIA